MGWIRKMKIGVLLSLVALSFTQPALAERNDQTLTEIYTAPDGRVIEREFDNRYLPRAVIIVCTDNSRSYFKPFQEFVSYVFADKNYTILDGSKDHKNLDKSQATFVYFGNPDSSGQMPSDSCLSKYPELKGFVEDKRDNAPRTISAVGIVPEARKEDVLLLNYTSFVGGEEGGYMNLFVGFCLQKDRTCEASSFITFFALQPQFCEENDNCNFIINEKE